MRSLPNLETEGGGCERPRRRKVRSGFRSSGLGLLGAPSASRARRGRQGGSRTPCHAVRLDERGAVDPVPLAPARGSAPTVRESASHQAVTRVCERQGSARRAERQATGWAGDVAGGEASPSGTSAAASVGLSAEAERGAVGGAATSCSRGCNRADRPVPLHPVSGVTG